MLIGHVRSCDLKWVGLQAIQTENVIEVIPSKENWGSVTIRREDGCPVGSCNNSTRLFWVNTSQGRPPNVSHLVLRV